MSLTLPNGAVRDPWGNGMIEGMIQADPRQYQHVAYRHPHGFTWFAGPQARAGEQPDYGGFVHYIRSAVQHKLIPPKDDREVAAVTYAGYTHLMQLEVEWWIDYDAHFGPARDAWAQANHPNVLIQLLPAPPANIHLAACKHAHRMVARREGREGELPNDFDQRENVEIYYHLFN